MKASVTRYWCDIGTTGTRTSTMRAISAANMPPASMTTSHSMSPWSVRTRETCRLESCADRVDAQNPRVGADRDAGLAGEVGQRVAELGRVDVAVGLEVGGADDAVGDHEREHVAGLVGRDLVQRQAVGVGPGDLPADLLQPLRRRGELDAAALDPARRVLGLLQLAVELDGVHVHPGQGRVGAQLPDQTGGVEGRPAGELVAVDQHDIGLAELGQVVGDAGAADASADDDDPGPIGKLAAGVAMASGAGASVTSRSLGSADPKGLDLWAAQSSCHPQATTRAPPARGHGG